ncbi:uncharacterized protein EV420DRAFT_1480917 [Desarmillaria tabescens]|uniref:Uncharacterized protein n=1 Tax=Armillaria tabescens TaxID=1929756 RepID=A0AA39K9G3_ARMTA|nr:uncharacterized protein EV420DRAFT_1480917 [Desarmillaria tabescens]KAK0457041.1 hypothetical protein EV420DRAFT_1480917 [Desarmillaria tabescens]
MGPGLIQDLKTSFLAREVGRNIKEGTFASDGGDAVDFSSNSINMDLLAYEALLTSSIAMFATTPLVWLSASIRHAIFISLLRRGRPQRDPGPWFEIRVIFGIGSRRSSARRLLWAQSGSEPLGRRDAIFVPFTSLDPSGLSIFGSRGFGSTAQGGATSMYKRRHGVGFNPVTGASVLFLATSGSPAGSWVFSFTNRS